MRRLSPQHQLPLCGHTGQICFTESPSVFPALIRYASRCCLHPAQRIPTVSGVKRRVEVHYSRVVRSRLLPLRDCRNCLHSLADLHSVPTFSQHDWQTINTGSMQPTFETASASLIMGFLSVALHVTATQLRELSFLQRHNVLKPFN